jgi:hypothetical protein
MMAITLLNASSCASSAYRCTSMLARKHLVSLLPIIFLPNLEMYLRRVGAIRDLLSGVTDSDWGNSSSRRSTSENLMLYNKAPVMSKFKIQKTTALSTAEAEYCQASTAGSEVLYLRKLLERVRPSVAHAGLRRQHSGHRVG